MEPEPSVKTNPFYDTWLFLVGEQPDELARGAWRWALLALFYALLAASLAIAARNWRTDPAQRTPSHAITFLMRLLVGCMWFQASLWKLPLFSTENGLFYWTQQMVENSAFDWHRALVQHVLLPAFVIVTDPLGYSANSPLLCRSCSASSSAPLPRSASCSWQISGSASPPSGRVALELRLPRLPDGPVQPAPGRPLARVRRFARPTPFDIKPVTHEEADMRSRLRLVLIAASLLLAPITTRAAEQVVEAARAALPESVRASGVLKVATSLQWPPYAFTSDAGTADGIDVRLVRLLAEKLGLRAEIEDVKFPAIVPGVSSGRYDVGLNQINITAERAKIVDFVPYSQDGMGLLIRRGTPALDVNDLCGRTLDLTQGSAQVGIAERLSADCEKAGKKAITFRCIPTAPTPTWHSPMAAATGS